MYNLAVLNSRFPLKRPIAILLPMTFLWLFMVCVFICAREGAEQHNQPLVSSSIEITDAVDCKGCPLASFPKATVPERAIVKLSSPAPCAVPLGTPPID